MKFNRKFSTTEMNIQNLTQTLVSVITRTRDLEEHGNVLFIIFHPNEMTFSSDVINHSYLSTSKSTIK